MGFARLDLEAIQLAYVDGKYPLHIIAKVFGTTVDEICETAKKFGWAPASKEDDALGIEPHVAFDPLGDALEAAGYRRHTVTTPGTAHPIFNWGLDR